MFFKEEMIQFLDKDKAEFIKFLRVQEGYSYRAIAEECIEKWQQDWQGGQLVGEDLCAAAMHLLNEIAEQGWN